MSYAFITAMNENPKQSYVQLLNSIREVLERKYTQKPQLSCSHPLGMTRHSASPLAPFYVVEYELITRLRRRESFVRHVKKGLSVVACLCRARKQFLMRLVDK